MPGLHNCPHNLPPLYKSVQTRLDRVLGLTRENLTGVRVVRAFDKEKSEVVAEAALFLGQSSQVHHPFWNAELLLHTRGAANLGHKNTRRRLARPSGEVIGGFHVQYSMSGV